MAQFILINGTTFPIDTDDQISAARTALHDANLESADVWAGVDDSTGDSYKTGHKLFSNPPTP